MTLGPGRERVVPFRGDYYTLTPDARSLIRSLTYPAPDPRFPFLGVHFTRRLDGEVWAGPNAVARLREDWVSTARRQRRRAAGHALPPGISSPGHPVLADGAVEMWRDWSKGAFLPNLQRFVPELRNDQIKCGPAGIRAQAVELNGSMVDDFRFGGVDRVINGLNAPSPAATSSRAIAAYVTEPALARLDA